jgi:hypothetical protein
MEITDVCLMNGEWDESVDENPNVKLPLWSIWDHICFSMYWNSFVQVHMMNAE